MYIKFLHWYISPWIRSLFVIDSVEMNVPASGISSAHAIRVDVLDYILPSDVWHSKERFALEHCVSKFLKQVSLSTKCLEWVLSYSQIRTIIYYHFNYRKSAAEFYWIMLLWYNCCIIWHCESLVRNQGLWHSRFQLVENIIMQPLEI